MPRRAGLGLWPRQHSAENPCAIRPADAATAHCRAAHRQGEISNAHGGPGCAGLPIMRHSFRQRRRCLEMSGWRATPSASGRRSGSAVYLSGLAANTPDPTTGNSTASAGRRQTGFRRTFPACCATSILSAKKSRADIFIMSSASWVITGAGLEEAARFIPASARSGRPRAKWRQQAFTRAGIRSGLSRPCLRGAEVSALARTDPSATSSRATLFLSPGKPKLADVGLIAEIRQNLSETTWVGTPPPYRRRRNSPERSKPTIYGPG